MRLCGVIVAGGASRRMGRNKLELPVPSPSGAMEPLLAHVVRVMQACCEEVYVLAGLQGTELPNDVQGVKVVHDERPFQGPLSALASAWPQVADADRIVVVAGDLPGLASPVIQACVDAEVWKAGGDTLDGVIVSREGHAQPLLGAYHPRVGHTFRVLHEQGETRLMRAIGGLNIQYMDAGARGWPIWWTKPVHTPEEYAAWAKEAGLDEAGSSR